jgi:hypothetical protein
MRAVFEWLQRKTDGDDSVAGGWLVGRDAGRGRVIKQKAD